MEKFLKLKTVFPILTGILVGSVLFAIGYDSDAPGMCLIGLIIAFLLIMWGIYQTDIFRKELFAPFIFFCFGAGAIILSIVLLLDGEFEDKPWLSAIGVVTGIILIIVALIKTWKTRRS